MSDSGKKKVIWIINQYATHSHIGQLGRHHFIAEELSARGYKVTLISSNQANISLKSNQQNIRSGEPKYNKVVLTVPEYPTSESYKRVLGWFIFAYKINSLPKVIGEKPDVIYYSSLSLPGSYTASKLAKSVGAKFVFEVRDIWPLTLMSSGGKSKSHPFVILLQLIEDNAYRNADLIFSNLQGLHKHVQNRKADPKKFRWIPSGFSRHIYKEVVSASENDNLEELWPPTPLVIGYVGSMGRANSLESLIDAATILKNDSRVKFVLVGSGGHKSDLVRLARSRKLNNVEFRDAVPKELVPSVVAEFDIGYRGSRIASHYRFGMAPNKIFDYIALGTPVLQSYSGNYDLIKKYNIGWTVPAGEPRRLASKIKEIMQLSGSEVAVIKENARKLAWEQHEFGKVTSKIEVALKAIE